MTQLISEDVSYAAVGEEPSPIQEGAPIRRIETLADFARHKWTILTITLGFMIVGLILCFTLPKRYQATATIMTPSQVPSISTMLDESGKGLGSLASAAGGLGLKDPNAIFIGMLQSRTIADALISEFNLRQVYGAADMTGTRKTLDKNSDIKAEKSNLVSVVVTDADPTRAAQLANAYVDQLRMLTKTMSAREAGRQRSFYEDQLKSQREALIAAELNFQQVQQNKGLVHITAQSAMMLEGVALIRAQIAAKEVELKALQSYSTEQNSDVQLAEQELAALKQSASRMSEHGGSSDYADIGLKDIPNAGLDFLRAFRDVQYQTVLYGALIKQYESFRLDEANDAYKIQVVDQAAVPDRRSSPKRSIVMIISTFMGFLVSLVWVSFRQKWMRWIADPTFVVALQELKTAVFG